MAINMNNGLWGCEKPIVVFFGETGCGKTTALVRLITFLHENNNYKYSYELCKTFHRHYYPTEPIYTVRAEFDKQFEVGIQEVEGTALSCFCNIMDGSEIVCRFLDTPGENLFSVSQEAHKANALKSGENVFQYQYLNDILYTNDYQKVWVFFMDIDMVHKHKAYAEEYLQNITRIANRIVNNESENDKMIFIINKEDKVREMYGPVLKHGCEAYINNLFNNILAEKPFTTETSILGIKRKKKHFRAIPFCSYTVKLRGKDMEGKPLPPEYELGSDAYPDDLWHTIQDAILYKF